MPDVLVVLGRGTHHGRAADVDQLDGGVRRERVEVRHHEVDGLDAVGRQVVEVLGLGAVGQDPAVDLGVQGLDPPAEHLGRAGHLRHLEVGDARLGQLGRRCCRWRPAPTPGPRDPGPARPGPPCRRRTAGPSRRHLRSSAWHRCRSSLLDRSRASTPRPASSSPRAQATVAGYRLRSTTLMRSCSVSSVSPGRTGTDLLGQDRPGIHLEGGQVHGASGLGDAGGQGVAHPVPAREGRQAGRGACSGSGPGRPGGRPRS